MTFYNFRLSSQSAPWYLFGCAAALPDLVRIKCDWKYIPTFNIAYFPTRLPYLIPFSAAVYAAVYYAAQQPKVAIRASFLGVITGLGILTGLAALPSYQGLGLYMTFLSWFHFSEYYFTESFNQKKVTLSSFMLNHSHTYNTALAFSIIEFLVERHFWPGMKERTIIIYFGLILCVFGEIIRKRAMYIAGPNFNHIVQYDLNKEEHKLVTNDIYGYIQHPSYTGWFTFTIGTQIMLCNPLCCITFPIIMYHFFEDRVKHEEPALVDKHGSKYRQYKENTPRFIPYVW